jgi:hypothetical protein
MSDKLQFVVTFFLYTFAVGETAVNDKLRLSDISGIIVSEEFV